MSKRTYILDGHNFSTLEDFWEEIGYILMGSRNAHWGRNLDAFRDILCGGWGTPDEGFILVWKNSAVSRERLEVILKPFSESLKHKPNEPVLQSS